MDFELVEPVRILFKDEVRVVGDELGLPHDMVYRQPFPGPGLGVRCPGAITRDRLEAVRESDAILATVYKGNIIKNLIMDCQSYTKYRPNETTGGIFVSWRRKEELPTGA